MLEMLDLVILDLILKLCLVVLLSDFILLRVDFLKISLLLLNFSRELVKLLMQVVIFILSIFLFLSDYVEFLRSLLELCLDNLDLIIDWLLLIVELLNEWLDLLQTFCLRDLVPHLLDVSKQLLFVLGLHGCSLITLVHIINVLSNVGGDLVFSLLRQVLLETVALMLKDIDLFLDFLCLIEKLSFLVSEALQVVDLGLEKLLVAQRRSLDLAALESFLLLGNDVGDLVSVGFNLQVVSLHLVVKLNAVGVALAFLLGDDGRNFCFKGNFNSLMLGSLSVMELVHP